LAKTFLENVWRVHFVDIFDIMQMLDAIRTGMPETSYLTVRTLVGSCDAILNRRTGPAQPRATRPSTTKPERSYRQRL
jgi:hypothetical protein